MRKFIFILCLLEICTSNLFAVKVTQETINDDGPVNYLYLDYGDIKFSFIPSWNWAPVVEGDVLTFIPKDIPLSKIAIVQIPIDQGVALELSKEQATEIIKNYLPSGAGALTSLEVKPDFLFHPSIPSCSITFSYPLMGSDYIQTLYFFNLGGRQMRFQLITTRKDYKQLSSLVQGSIDSWRVLPGK